MYFLLCVVQRCEDGCDQEMVPVQSEERARQGSPQEGTAKLKNISDINILCLLLEHRIA